MSGEATENNQEATVEEQTKNSTEIKRGKTEAEIRFTLSIEQYEIYTSLKPEILKACNVSSVGDLFMQFFLKKAKEFGLE
jgi:hypothetical protein